MVSVSVVNYRLCDPGGMNCRLIFNKFYRVEQSRSTNHGGNRAWGLPLSKNIVDMHGGTISVTSDLNGTVFHGES